MRTILETVNFLATSGACFIVLGLERKAVLVVLRETYGEDAERYLEKIFTMEERLPVLTPDGLSLLMAGDSGSPAPPRDEPMPGRLERITLGTIARIDRWLVPVVLATFLAFGGWQAWSGYAGWTPPGETPAEATPEAPLAEPSGEPPASSGAPPTPADETEPVLMEIVLPERSALPDLLAGAAILLLLGAGIVVARGALPSLRGEDDSPEFRRALAAWGTLVHADNPTPRALKRFQNRARFVCLRARAYGERLPEPLVVALAALEEVFPDLLGAVETDVVSALAARGGSERLRDLALDILRTTPLPLERRTIERYRFVAGGPAFRGGAGVPPEGDAQRAAAS